ncbi:MAG: histidine phosphatase family protein [Actinomycetota bacterium]
MLARLHLVRHGEVHNPGGVVYAGLPGYPLSALGRSQAAAAAEHLADSGASVLVTSPLDRARETASFIASRLGLEPVIDEGLTEWGLSTRWAGTAWSDLDQTFPGELAAYASNPADLAFSPESLTELALRAEAAILRLEGLQAGEVAIAVSHQDPIQALRRSLLRRGFADFHTDKPGHATVITLEQSEGAWHEVEFWSPPIQTPAFPPASP